MSWSVSIIGTPAKMCEKLDEYGNSLTGQSKAEFDEAKPHLQSLIKQNVGGVGGNLLRLNASGHATFKNGEKEFGNLAVSIEQLYATFAI